MESNYFFKKAKWNYIITEPITSEHKAWQEKLAKVKRLQCQRKKSGENVNNKLSSCNQAHKRVKQTRIIIESKSSVFRCQPLECLKLNFFQIFGSMSHHPAWKFDHFFRSKLPKHMRAIKNALWIDDSL